MRQLITVAFVIAAFCSHLIGQILTPSTIDFPLVRQAVEGGDRLVVLTPWYTMFGNIRGDAALSAQPDISADSMATLTGDRERYWSMKVVSRDGLEMELELREFGSGAARGSFKETVNHQGGSQWTTDSLFKDVSGHTFDWSVCFNDTAYIDAGDEFRFYFWRTRFAQGSDLAALGVYSLPSTDTLTIAAWDTITAITDTFYTGAVPGDVGYISLFIDQYPKVSGNVSSFGVGLQVKVADGEWSRPLGNSRDKIKTVVDSAACDSAVVSERIGNIPADSVRYVFWGKSAADIIFRKIRALWRD